MEYQDFLDIMGYDKELIVHLSDPEYKRRNNSIDFMGIVTRRDEHECQFDQIGLIGAAITPDEHKRIDKVEGFSTGLYLVDLVSVEDAKPNPILRGKLHDYHVIANQKKAGWIDVELHLKKVYDKPEFKMISYPLPSP